MENYIVTVRTRTCEFVIPINVSFERFVIFAKLRAIKNCICKDVLPPDYGFRKMQFESKTGSYDYKKALHILKQKPSGVQATGQ